MYRIISSPTRSSERSCLNRFSLKLMQKPPKRDKNTITTRKTIRNDQFCQDFRIVRFYYPFAFRAAQRIIFTFRSGMCRIISYPTRSSEQRSCLNRFSLKLMQKPPKRDKNAITTRKTIRNDQFCQNWRIVRFCFGCFRSWDPECIVLFSIPLGLLIGSCLNNFHEI